MLSPFVSGGAEAFRLERPKVLERIALSSATTNGALSVMQVVVERGGLVAPVHVHTEEDETAFVLEGTVGARLAEEELLVGPGTTVFGPRGVPHSFWNAGKDTARMPLVITPGNLDEYFQEMTDITGTDPVPDTNGMVRHAARFGITFDLDSIADLAARHHVSLV